MGAIPMVKRRRGSHAGYHTSPMCFFCSVVWLALWGGAAGQQAVLSFAVLDGQGGTLALLAQDATVTVYQEDYPANLQVVVDGAVGSIKGWTLSFNPRVGEWRNTSNVVNTSPFVLPWTSEIGTHLLVASSFSGPDGSGDQGSMVSCTLVVQIREDPILPPTPGWHLDALKGTPAATYPHLLSLSEMVKWTYIDSAYSTSQAPLGWNRYFDGGTRPQTAMPGMPGVHGIVYMDDSFANSRRVVIALRGTADTFDECVDMDLWREFADEDLELAAICANITSSGVNLDYVQQTVELYQNIKQQWSDADVLFTGHSMGGGIAMLAGLITGNPVIAFSGPGIELAAKRTGVALDVQRLNNIFNFGDQSDPVIRFTASAQIAHLCLWQTPISQDCLQCLDYVADACSRCWYQTHHFASVIRTIDRFTEVQCSMRPENTNSEGGSVVVLEKLNGVKRSAGLVLGIGTMLFMATLGLLIYVVYQGQGHSRKGKSYSLNSQI